MLKPVFGVKRRMQRLLGLGEWRSLIVSIMKGLSGEYYNDMVLKIIFVQFKKIRRNWDGHLINYPTF